MTQDYARQGIVTRYHGPTDRKGSRISATCDAGRVIVSYDHALNSFRNHREAARALAIKLGWLDDGWTLYGCSMPQKSRDAYAFALVPPSV